MLLSLYTIFLQFGPFLCFDTYFCGFVCCGAMHNIDFVFIKKSNVKLWQIWAMNDYSELQTKTDQSIVYVITS